MVIQTEGAKKMHINTQLPRKRKIISKKGHPDTCE
jgi:hypothetical protein